ncbi:hypothetical protein JTE90_017502 [Oedothorax gibbosus]|uniref:Uncharacterized protein n=1 Tax=Oedothorax gibbosus TaxID=931172 RepID=A0AAV6UCA1_9ARAC|nr:hypothetical protein JTE90_017502 [Oedothorax gibbosus]
MEQEDSKKKLKRTNSANQRYTFPAKCYDKGDLPFLPYDERFRYAKIKRQICKRSHMIKVAADADMVNSVALRSRGFEVSADRWRWRRERKALPCIGEKSQKRFIN